VTFAQMCTGAGNDYQKDKQFKKLNAQKDKLEVKVIRDGEQILVENTEVVVGDLLLLDTGDKIVADGIVAKSFHLVVDEAALTGESEPLPKGDDDMWCMSGSEVIFSSSLISLSVMLVLCCCTTNIRNTYLVPMMANDGNACLGHRGMYITCFSLSTYVMWSMPPAPWVASHYCASHTRNTIWRVITVTANPHKGS